MKQKVGGYYYPPAYFFRMKKKKIAKKLKSIIKKMENLLWSEGEKGVSEQDIINGFDVQINSLKDFLCEIKRGHDFVYDQCGYWQHQFCIECGAAKYKDLSSKRCGTLDKEMGKITEEQYIASHSYEQTR